MKSLNILLNSIDKVKAFVNIINSYEGDFDFVSDRYLVDAKSIMGIFSLDLSKPLRLDIHDASVYGELAAKLESFTA